MHFTSIIYGLAALSSLVIAAPAAQNTTLIDTPEIDGDASDIVSVNALGINCRGSGLCSRDLGELRGYVNNAPNDRKYYNTQHVACKRTNAFGGGMCVFLQYMPGNPGVEGRRIKYLMDALAGHGCKGCGSVPVAWPNNDPNREGILTVNYVKNTDNPCPTGLCP